MEAAMRMVGGGLGVASLPLPAVVHETRRRRLLAITVRDAEPLSRSLDLIHPRQRPLSAEAQGLLKTLRAAGRGNAPARPGRAPLQVRTGARVRRGRPLPPPQPYIPRRGSAAPPPAPRPWAA